MQINWSTKRKNIIRCSSNENSLRSIDLTPNPPKSHNYIYVSGDYSFDLNSFSPLLCLLNYTLPGCIRLEYFFGKNKISTTAWLILLVILDLNATLGIILQQFTGIMSEDIEVKGLESAFIFSVPCEVLQCQHPWEK